MDSATYLLRMRDQILLGGADEEDVAQDATCRLLEWLAQVGWSHTIPDARVRRVDSMARLMIDLARKEEAKRKELVRPLRKRFSGVPELDLVEWCEALEVAFRALPESDQQILRWAYRDERTIQCISGILGCSLGKAHRLLHDAVQRWTLEVQKRGSDGLRVFSDRDSLRTLLGGIG